MSFIVYEGIADLLTNGTAVPVQLHSENYNEFQAWFEQNNISSVFAYGKYYFMKEEDAVAFRIKFGDKLGGV